MPLLKGISLTGIAVAIFSISWDEDRLDIDRWENDGGKVLTHD